MTISTFSRQFIIITTMKDLRGDEKTGTLVLTVYQPAERSSNAFNFRQLCAEYNCLSNYSGKIYKSKAELKGRNVTFISTKDAANGKAPRFDYQEILFTKIKKLAEGFQYLIGKPQQPISLQKVQTKDLKKLPYLCLTERFNHTKQQIKLDDIIRIGQVFLKVIHIGNVQSQKAAIQVVEVNKRKDQSCCRFCLEVQNTEEYIQPCICIGSLLNIHFSCLKQWRSRNSKINILNNQNGVIRYDQNKMECQICKHHVANTYKIKNTNMSLINYDKSDGNPYIVLQILTNHKTKTVFKVTPKDKKIKIGSLRTSDMKIAESYSESVDQNHAEISFSNNKFYIQDKNSKYGTLILMKDQLKIESQTCIFINNRAYHIDPKTRTK